MRKRIIFKLIIITLLFDVVIGFLLLKNRYFSHLAIWSVAESSNIGDFYWRPEKAPAIFHAEVADGKPSIFYTVAFPIIAHETEELGKILKIAQFVYDLNTHSGINHLAVRFDSPAGILHQIQSGANGNCFHRSILFSALLSSVGIPSRLWALENMKFDGMPHTIIEAYNRDAGKWVFVDTMLGFYATDNNSNPLNFLELRKIVLEGDQQNVKFQSLISSGTACAGLFARYNSLVNCVFLRMGNDFIGKYDSRARYGTFFFMQKQIDRFPDFVRRGLGYALGRRDVFMHYVDVKSPSFKIDITIAKALFYFFCVSLLLVAACTIALIFL